MPLTVQLRWVRSVDDIEPSLWDVCFAPPLEGRWWYAALQHCGIDDQFTFAYGVLSRAGTDIGIVPAFQMNVPLDIIAPDQIAALVRLAGKAFRPLRYQRTLFVGSPCSDEGSVGLIAGEALAGVIDVIQDAIELRAKETRASMIVWKDFAEHDQLALSAMAAKRNLFRVASFPGTRLSLPVGKFESYLSALTSSHRHHLKKKLKRGKAVCPTIASVVQHPEEAVLAELFPLFWQTYEKGKTKFEKLNVEFYRQIAKSDAAYFVLLRDAAGRLVAFMLCFDCGPRAINKFIGIDYAIDDAYLYFQLWEAAVRWAMERHFTDFQSGQTGYRAKLDVGHKLVPLDNFCRHRNPLVNRVFAWQAKTISWKTIDSDLKNYLDAHPLEVPRTM